MKERLRRAGIAVLNRLRAFHQGATLFARRLLLVIALICIIAVIVIIAVPLKTVSYTVEVPYQETETYYVKEPYEVEERVERQEPYEVEEPYREVKQESEELVDESFTVAPGSYEVFSTGLSLRDDARVNGLVVETAGRGIDFYVFDRQNYDRWRADRTAAAVVKREDITTSSFGFVPEASGTYYFVVDNRESWVTSKSVELNATWTWESVEEGTRTVTRYRTVTEVRTVTKYREVPKTRTVTRYNEETRRKRVTYFDYWMHYR